MTEMEGTLPMEEVVDATLSISEIPSEANAEVIDGRTGHDGTGYGSIGEAIREQIGDLWDGKAPAGHGLGGSGAYVDNLDTLKTTGVYTFTHSATGNPFSGWGGIAVVTASKTGIEQVLTCNTKNGVSCRRLMYLDSDKTTFEEWEWINPPMVLGTEYRTTERYNGSPVYKQLIDIGEMPQSTGKSVSHGISKCRPIKVTGRATYSAITLPYVSANGTAFVRISANSSVVQIHSNYNHDNGTGTVQVLLEYYKA